MKINKKVIVGAVTVVVLGLITLAVVNGPVLWEMVLRMHKMR